MNKCSLLRPLRYLRFIFSSPPDSETADTALELYLIEIKKRPIATYQLQAIRQAYGSTSNGAPHSESYRKTHEMASARDDTLIAIKIVDQVLRDLGVKMMKKTKQSMKTKMATNVFNNVLVQALVK